MERIRNSRSDARFSVLAVMALGSTVTIAAFFTPNWLASDTRLYGTEFVKMGLWETCFRSLKGPDDLEFRKYFSGCRWIFREEYQSIRSFLTPGQLPSFGLWLSPSRTSSLSPSSTCFLLFRSGIRSWWCLRKWKSGAYEWMDPG